MAKRQVTVQLKRAYAAPSEEDGIRILVDRLWPRGLRKADAAIDQWLKDLAPSTDLRQWFGHDSDKWKGFRRRYTAELKREPERLRALRAIARKHRVTLVYGARDEEHNEAVVLRDLIAG